MITIMAPHVIAKGQQERADFMSEKVGESMKNVPGFLFRMVLQSRKDPNVIWSLTTWESYEAHEQYLKMRKMPWTRDEVLKTYAKMEARIEESEPFNVLRLEIPGRGFQVVAEAFGVTDRGTA